MPSAAPVFVDGKKFRPLHGPNIAADFKVMVIDTIDHRYGSDAALPAQVGADAAE